MFTGSGLEWNRRLGYDKEGMQPGKEGASVKRNLIILGVVALSIAAVLVLNRPHGAETESGGGARTAAAAEAPKQGYAAPAFALKGIDGTSSFQVGGPRGKPLIVNFWASWCGPCEAEAPDLKKLYAAYKDRVDLYAVNATKYDTVRGAKDFVKEQQLPFPVLMDTDGKAGDVYKVFAYPTSFIIDRKGIVRERIEGVQSVDEWARMLNQVLKDPS